MGEPTPGAPAYSLSGKDGGGGWRGPRKRNRPSHLSRCPLKPAKLKATNMASRQPPLCLCIVSPETEYSMWLHFAGVLPLEGSGLAFDDLGLKIQLWLL